MKCEVLIEGQLVELEQKLYRFGRHPDCEIRSTHRAVSRYACTLYRLDSEEWCLLDGSPNVNKSHNRNGIRVNNKLVDATDGIYLRHGDIVNFAPDSYLQFFAQDEQNIDLQATFSDWRSG